MEVQVVKIESYEVERIKDPTGIIPGDRYEFLLGIEVPEDDELYVEGNSLDLRVNLAVVNDAAQIKQYHFINRSDGKILEFGLEDEEESMVLAFCMDKYPEAE